MRRLAVITNYFPSREQPHRGQSAYQTLRILVPQMDIQVFYPAPLYPSWLRPRSFAYKHPDPGYATEVPVRYVGYPAMPIVSRPLNGLAAAQVLFPHVHRFRPDLILNYMLYPDGFASVLLGKRLNVPVILGAIGSDLHSIPDLISRSLTRRALLNASFVITVSEDLRRKALCLGARSDRTRTVRNGVDTAIFRVRDRLAARKVLGVDSGSRLVLFVGWLAARKGIAELVDAVARLLPDHSGLKLVCIGEGLLHDELPARISRGALSSNVLFTGPCSSEQVATWMSAADVFCLPSHAEGCPNVILEALACGLPTVASAVGGIPEIVGDRCGILVPPGDPERLSDALAAALKAEWDAEAISQRSRRSWDHVAAETLEICRDAVALPQI